MWVVVENMTVNKESSGEYTGEKDSENGSEEFEVDPLSDFDDLVAEIKDDNGESSDSGKAESHDGENGDSDSFQMTF